MYPNYAGLYETEELRSLGISDVYDEDGNLIGRVDYDDSEDEEGNDEYDYDYGCRDDA